jgi:hypothetical protein
VLHFNKSYFIATVLLFCIEIFIALFIHDAIIRPYIGDALVVILIYSFVKSFLKITPLKAAIGVLLFAYAIEIAQYFNLCSLLRLEHNKLATIVLGNTFGIEDILMYTIGLLLTLIIEKSKGNRLK